MKNFTVSARARRGRRSVSRMTLEPTPRNRLSRLVCLAAVGTFVAIVPTVASPAHAESCYYKSGQEVTPEEYAQITPGMTFREVRDTIGSVGRLWSSAKLHRPVQEMYRVWHVCSRDGQVGMLFQREAGAGIVLQSAGVRWD